MSGLGRGRFDRNSVHAAQFSIQETHRRMCNMVRFGTISKIDHNKGVCRIKVGPLETAWMPWHTRHAGQDVDWAPPSAGEQVTLLCPSGNLTQAVVIHGLYQDKFKQPSNNKNMRVHNIKDGTSITHDTQKKQRVVNMPKDGAHGIVVDKQQQIVDTNGTRLVNDQGTVHVHPEGKIRVVSTSGSTIVNGSAVFINC